MEAFKAERSLKEDHKNVDNRIQYVGQIGVKENTQAKSRKKPKSRNHRVMKKEEQRAFREEGPVPYIT